MWLSLSACLWRLRAAASAGKQSGLLRTRGDCTAARIGFTEQCQAYPPNKRVASGTTVGDDDEIANLDSIEVHHTAGRAPLIVSEAGFYKLVLRSRKPVAKEFQRWVTHEVLPSIRKHGGYMAGQEAMSPEQMLAASMRWLESRIAEQQGQINAQQAQLDAQAPKVLFADAVSTSKRCILVGELAKILRQNGVDMGEKRLFAWLREHGYLMKRNGITNYPTQRSMDLKLFEIKETPIVHSDGHTTLSVTTKVTPKGQMYFINKFLEGDL